jgi:hypothetical protein
MGILLWVKEQFAKLRSKHDDEYEDAKQRQLQAVDGGNAMQRPRGCSVIFARARKHHEDRRSRRRKKARSRSVPARVSDCRSEDGSNRAAKACVVCQTVFQATTSKYLDYCSTECKTKASAEKGTAADAQGRASEWI